MWGGLYFKSLNNGLVKVTDKCCKKKEHCVPVSYTHLDVYKRQVLLRSAVLHDDVLVIHQAHALHEVVAELRPVRIGHACTFFH